jgi:hypothetical protein
MRSYIADGYTESGYIAEKPGIYEAVRFKYRRMLHPSLAKVRDKMNLGSYEGAKAIYPEIASRVTEWDIKEYDKDGKEVGTLKVGVNEIAHLATQLVEKLFNIIAGYLPNDTEDAGKSDSKDEIDALVESTTETDAKN